MTFSYSPIFTQTIKSNTTQITAANISRTAPSNGSTIYSSGTNGSLVNYVNCHWATSNVAGLIFLFTYDGTNYRLINEYSTTATTPSSTVPGFSLNIPLNFTIQSGYSLYITNYNAETVNFYCQGSDY